MSCVREEGYGLGREAISCMRQNMKGKALGHLLPACFSKGGLRAARYEVL
jgi:hypothetical protein